MAAAFLLPFFSAFAQSPTFDVASVRPSTPTNSDRIDINLGTFRNGVVTLTNGVVTYATNALGGVTIKHFTATGLPESQQNPDGSTHSWAYDLTGRVVKETLANGNYWQSTDVSPCFRQLCMRCLGFGGSSCADWTR